MNYVIEQKVPYKLKLWNVVRSAHRVEGVLVADKVCARCTSQEAAEAAARLLSDKISRPT